MRIKRPTNKRRIANGRELLRLYCKRAVLLPMERADDSSVTDTIADVLHYARSKGFDVESIHRRALEHHEAEVIEGF